VLESFGDKPSDLARLITGQLVDQAKAAIDFPSQPDRSLDGWIRARVPKEWNTAAQLAPLTMALAPLAEETWWPEVIGTLLRRWSGAQLSVDPPEPKDLRKAVTLISQDPRPARGAIALNQAEIAAHIKTKGLLLETTERREQLIAINRDVTAERDSLRQDKAALSQQLEAAKADVSRFRAVAEQTRRDARQEVAQSSVHGDNRVGRLAFQVTTVLEREIEELKLYLERAEPNVAGALRRVGELERLREDVRVIRDETDR
jgi:hypothetical protein